MRAKQRIGFVAGLLFPVALVGASNPDSIERVSVDSGGIQGNSNSGGSSINVDGRFVAFASLASNLVPDDTNGGYDIFVHDRDTGVTERVSVDSAGIEGNGYSTLSPSISMDGRYVAFWSSSSNLVPDDTNGQTDIFMHDRDTGETERVSVDSEGIQGNKYSDQLSISADGRYVAFHSLASNLVSDDTNARHDVFVHDRDTGVTERMSVDSAGIQGNSDSISPSISADGRFFAFTSGASNLVPGDTNDLYDVFVHDRVAGVTERVSVDSAGIQGNSRSFGSSISADGRFITFGSSASNLVLDDTNGSDDVFVHDRNTGVTERVSVDSEGIQGNSLSSSSCQTSTPSRLHGNITH
jgi:Tol biopolymer transport system component